MNTENFKCHILICYRQLIFFRNFINYLHTYLHIFTQIHIYTKIYKFIYIYIYIYKFIYIYIYKYTIFFTYTYYTYIYIYIQIYSRTTEFLDFVSRWFYSLKCIFTLTISVGSIGKRMKIRLVLYLRCVYTGSYRYYFK